MPELPRRLPPTAEERLHVIASRMAGGSAAGQTRWAKPVTEQSRTTLANDRAPDPAGVLGGCTFYSYSNSDVQLDPTPQVAWGDYAGRFTAGAQSVTIEKAGCYLFRLTVALVDIDDTQVTIQQGMGNVGKLVAQHVIKAAAGYHQNNVDTLPFPYAVGDSLSFQVGFGVGSISQLSASAVIFSSPVDSAPHDAGGIS